MLFTLKVGVQCFICISTRCHHPCLSSWRGFCCTWRGGQPPWPRMRLGRFRCAVELRVCGPITNPYLVQPQKTSTTLTLGMTGDGQVMGEDRVNESPSARLQVEQRPMHRSESTLP